MYKTFDGEVFEAEEEARNYERLLQLKNEYEEIKISGSIKESVIE